MATFIQEKMPRVNPKDAESSLKNLYKYVESLNEQLAYLFGNLGGDNFNQQDMNNFIANLNATNIITQTIVSNAVVTKSLYAERGDIAQLTVDWLSTSKKVMKFLAEDTTNDDYIEIHEQGIELKSASVVMSDGAPLTEILSDRSGNPLYWQQDISYAEIVDGLPYVNGKQVYMDTEVTDYPVRVYKYNVTTKMLIDFEEVNGVNVPKITMGNVTITDNNITIGDKSLKDVSDGEDGVSCTHAWNGTVLTVTSASGTSSADLKGEKGDRGNDGYTPVKNVDYFDGKDGKDGAAGSPGKDGYTPIKGVDYFDGKDGQAGKDGVSCSHSWNGTTLTVTSASGTSSANLKGDKGDKGDPGDPSNGVSKTEHSTLNSDISTTWVTYGTRKLTVTGNDITFDMSAAPGGWACNFASITDPVGDNTPMLGVYGGEAGLIWVYMGGTYDNPAMRMTKDGQFTFKNVPIVGSSPLGYAPIISPSDITAGSTGLSTGFSYHVYE